MLLERVTLTNDTQFIAVVGIIAPSAYGLSVILPTDLSPFSAKPHFIIYLSTLCSVILQEDNNRWKFQSSRSLCVIIFVDFSKVIEDRRHRREQENNGRTKIETPALCLQFCKSDTRKSTKPKSNLYIFDRKLPDIDQHKFSDNHVLI